MPENKAPPNECVVPHTPSPRSPAGRVSFATLLAASYPSCSRYSLIALAAMANARLATGHARVQSDLEQHLLNLLLGEAVAQRRLDVHVQLVLVLQRGEDGERDDGPLRPRKPGA